MTPSELAHLCGYPLERLVQLAEVGVAAYQPPRNKGSPEKPRWIRPPKPELKLVQRRLLNRVLPHDLPHPAAFNAKGAGGTVAAAKRHVGHPYLLHLDIANFFPSVAPRRVLDRLIEVGCREDTANLLTELTTVAGELPQGAPTSPAIGDLVLHPVDKRIAGFASNWNWSYTRYVDDIALSGGNGVAERGFRLLRRCVEGEGWTLNDKGGVFGPSTKKEILGLSVGSELGVPRHVRRRIRSFIGLIGSGKVMPSAKELERIRGQIAWIFTVNPQQGQELRFQLEQAEVS